MRSENFEQGPIRPPGEADSLLIRITRGCPWNRCAFCTLYKGLEFSIRPVSEIKKDIAAARKCYGDAPIEKCFLQDGDSFAMETGDLVEVLRELKQAFPSLKQISSYGRAQSLTRKSPEEMKEIGDAGLNMLYCGMESGSQKVLKKVRKGLTVRSIIDSSNKAKDAGMEILLFAILGLGGKELTQSHADETAALINRIDPAEIRILSLAIKPGTVLDAMVKEGAFTPLTELEMVEEQQRILRQMNGISSQYGNYHGVNLLTELQGQLPHDKTRLLAITEQFLSLSRQEQNNFIFGRRNGYYAELKDMQQAARHALVQAELERCEKITSGQLETYFHDCRRRWI